MEDLIKGFRGLTTDNNSGLRLLWIGRNHDCWLLYQHKLCRISFVGSALKKDGVQARSIHRSPRFIRHWRCDDNLLREIATRYIKECDQVEMILQCMLLICTDEPDMTPMSGLLKSTESGEHGCSYNPKYAVDHKEGPRKYTFGSGYLTHLLIHLVDMAEWAAKEGYNIELTSDVLMFPELTTVEKESKTLITTLPVVDGYSVSHAKRPAEMKDTAYNPYRDVHCFLVACDLECVVAKEDLSILQRLQRSSKCKTRADLVADKDSDKE